MTVHDLDAARRPELHPPRAVAIQRAQLAAARDRASVVLTSAATATALTEEGVDRDRIVVTTYGVTPLPDPDFTLVPSDPFFLVVGSLNLRKGQDLLVAALARSALASVHLVLAGPEGWGASRVRSAIARHGLENRVTIIGRVSDAQLAGLYRSCIALCVPSRAEGFGIPILEASRLGVPVVASDIPASRELEQAVALFAPAADEQAWATVLERIVDDEDLRASTADRGPAFARRFTWDRVAQITLGAYRKALGTG